VDAPCQLLSQYPPASGGLLLAIAPRIELAKLLRQTCGIDVLWGRATPTRRAPLGGCGQTAGPQPSRALFAPVHPGALRAWDLPAARDVPVLRYLRELTSLSGNLTRIVDGMFCPPYDVG
jgi:hypothetical protein